MATGVNAKIELVVSVLDELAIIPHLDNYSHKLQAIGVMRKVLESFNIANNPNKADSTIQSIKLLANVQNSNLEKHLLGLTTLAEKALSELHNQYLTAI